MRTIRAEALRPDHLEGFDPVYPMWPIPEAQWGQAVAYVDNGVVLGILGGWMRPGGAVDLGLYLSEEALRRRVTLHRAALCFIGDAVAAGYAVLRAWPVDDRAARWLSRLGFEQVDSGAYERCLIQ